jgi:glycosyltransferase involved in cell wall biosynthesis
MLRNKGISEFVQAAGLLHQQGLSVKCQLLGFFDESPDAISPEEIEDWHSRQIITYLGYTDKVPDLIRQADCIVLPSYREGIPLSLLEGASMCKALIAADTAGCRTLIEEGVNGYLCREKDPGDLARKMETYYRLSAEDKKKMGMEGRKKVLENFTSQRITGIYLEKISLLQGVTHELA